MSKISYHQNIGSILVDPNLSDFEVVERKFRGHPDSLADMVAKRFAQMYIQKTWKLFPELYKKCFPNFSADKVTLTGATTTYSNGKYDVVKNINALLIGKITSKIGTISLDIDDVFDLAIKDIFSKALGNDEAYRYVDRQIYSVKMAGTDHNPSFYAPKSTTDLLAILDSESVANDTVYVVAYAPLSVAEKLSIEIDNFTYSDFFKNKFPEIGSDIKAMIRRRDYTFDVTLCLPVLPEFVNDNKTYNNVVYNATKIIKNYIEEHLRQQYIEQKSVVNLWVNTKDTKDKKYFAVWGTALSKGDIGAVGRGNRHQGFISGIRPSTNEAVSGKNPNHFAGIIYQLLAEEIANKIYKTLGIKNVIYITANNGDQLNNPNSVDILLSEQLTMKQKNKITEIINDSLSSADKVKLKFVEQDVFLDFMKPSIN